MGSDPRGMGLKIRQATRKGWIEVPEGGCFDAAYPKSKLRRGRVQGGGQISPTITCNIEIYVYEGKYWDTDQGKK